MAKGQSPVSEPMPARPSAGPSDHSTPRGRKLRVMRAQLVSVGCRVIARRVCGGIGDPATPTPTHSDPFSLRSSESLS